MVRLERVPSAPRPKPGRAATVPENRDIQMACVRSQTAFRLDAVSAAQPGAARGAVPVRKPADLVPRAHPVSAGGRPSQSSPRTIARRRRSAIGRRSNCARSWGLAHRPSADRRTWRTARSGSSSCTLMGSSPLEPIPVGESSRSREQSCGTETVPQEESHGRKGSPPAVGDL